MTTIMSLDLSNFDCESHPCKGRYPITASNFSYLRRMASMTKIARVDRKILPAVKMPSVLTLLLLILFACVLATYLMPAGLYELTDKKTVVPGSYAGVENQPVSFMGALTALHTGMVDSAPIIFGILFTGGAFAVLDATGTIRGAISRIVEKSGTNKYVVLSVVMLFFGITAAIGVITSEVIAFFPIGFMIAAALRLDAVTGLLIVLLPNAVGYATSFINPSSLALAQTVSGLPLFSGMEYRIAVFCVLMIVTMMFVFFYVKKVSRDASRRLLLDTPFVHVEQDEDSTPAEFGIRQKLTLTVFLAVLAFFVAGTALYQWGIGEMAACFILIALLAGLIFRMSADKLTGHFIDGVRSLIFVALIIGVARAITVVLQDGMILDTLIYALNHLMEPLSPHAGAVAILGTSGLVNFFVGSGTGQAALTIPVIAPLTDLLDISRQIGILCFQLGDGITNILYPTSAVLMAGLAMAKISYGRWVRFIAPYIGLVAAIAAVAIIVGVSIGYK